ncbi:putative holin [Craterilacuibacter sp. RT1T]|uniref:putative holin n=1 Tax=Craterilacuibacter sp. RT1T TaxID=2942211 RepID=UPI0020C0546B|nr:putative holin [Craterilacuibacter sp. RT1T]MCL6262186.1 phage holin family protein [Craterilacuibacter sp. RT1T]
MAEPISSTAVTGSVFSVALLSMFPGVEAAVVLGAFAGAVVFVLSSSDLGLVAKAASFVVSFIAGCIGSGFMSGLVAALTPQAVQVPEGVGALLAAALAVKLLLWLIRKADNPEELIGRGRK